MSTRFSPPSRFRSTRAPAPRPLPADRGKQRFVRANLLAHDDDLVPFAGRRTIARRFQRLRRLQERILVAPDEIDLQQLEAQIAPVRLALERNAHQIGRLVVQTVGHVEVGLGQGIALIEIDGALARHGVFGSFEVGLSIAEACRPVRRIPAADARPIPRPRTTRSPLRSAKLGTRVAEIGRRCPSIRFKSPPPPCRRRRSGKRQHAESPRRCTAAGTHQLVGHPVDPRSRFRAARPPASSAPGAGRRRRGHRGRRALPPAAATGVGGRDRRRRRPVTGAGVPASVGAAWHGRRRGSRRRAVGGTPSLRCSAASSLLRMSINRCDSASCPSKSLTRSLSACASALAALESPLPVALAAGARSHETQVAAAGAAPPAAAPRAPSGDALRSSLRFDSGRRSRRRRERAAPRRAAKY